MTIKFPDFQVLVSRSEQIPRTTRERDEAGAAGKMAPQVTQEFAAREKRIDETPKKEKIRQRKEGQKHSKGRNEEKEKKQNRERGRRIDLRA
ncbi:MAG: hypothetical protein GX335_06435 [Firmicutes bacterium]|nr:hypothetical protein [Bacillota bacterium]